MVTRAAFIKSDGTIVDIDGTSPVTFTGLPAGNYYMVVRHRNHLAIMTAAAIPLSSSSELYNFTTAQTLCIWLESNEVSYWRWLWNDCW